MRHIEAETKIPVQTQLQDNSKKVVLIIPTYNELENIEHKIESLLSLFLHSQYQLEIIIVDDNSPDGTSELIKNLSERQTNVHLLRRANKNGLGAAYKAGYMYALKNFSSDYIVQMDADISHDPKFLPAMLAELEKGSDMVIGSRRIPGGKIIGWGIQRILISLFANLLADITIRITTRRKVKDYTSGYRCYKNAILSKIPFDNLKADGYSFQLETLYYLLHSGAKVSEVPIVYVNRQIGKSKLQSSEIGRYIQTCINILFTSIAKKY